jgi:hypothetical protein
MTVDSEGQNTMKSASLAQLGKEIDVGIEQIERGEYI